MKNPTGNDQHNMSVREEKEKWVERAKSCNMWHTNHGLKFRIVFLLFFKPNVLTNHALKSRQNQKSGAFIWNQTYVCA